MIRWETAGRVLDSLAAAIAHSSRSGQAGIVFLYDGQAGAILTLADANEIADFLAAIDPTLAAHQSGLFDEEIDE